MNVERNEEFLQKLEKFLNETKGKEFKLSAAKILRRKSQRPGTEKNFFCSELIGSAYKALGLLGENCDSCKLWPVHFEKEKCLDLIDCSLGEIKMIDFDLE